MEQFSESCNVQKFSASYKALSEAVSAAQEEDLHQCLDTAIEKCEEIKKILFEKAKNLSRPQKYSLETSLALFLEIKSFLSDNLKQGGEVAVDKEPDSNSLVKWIEASSALQNRIKKGLIVNREHVDYEQFMDEAKGLFEQELEKVLKIMNAVKVNVELAAEYVKVKNEVEEKDIFQFNTKNVNIFQTTNTDEKFQAFRKKIDKKMSEFQESGSGWTLKKILHLVVNINKYNPMRVGSHIELPKQIKDKKACINVKNKDNECFKWSIIAGLYEKFYSNQLEKELHEKSYCKDTKKKIHEKPYNEDSEKKKKKKLHDPQRVNHYNKLKHGLNFKNIEFPVEPSNIAKFENQNDVSVNCYILKRFNKTKDLDKDFFEVSPIHLTNQKKEKHVNLLLIQDRYDFENGEDLYCENDDIEPPKYHYVFIESLSRLVRSQISKKQNKCYICERCLHYFWNQDKLDKHGVDCAEKNKCRIYLPPRGKICEFKNFNKKERVPAVIYADCESLLKPRKEDDHERCINTHHLLSLGFYVKYSDEIKDPTAISEYKSYRQIDESSESAARWFVYELKAIVKKMEQIYENIQPMDLSEEEMYTFKIAELCHICSKPFYDKDPKVRDHCHLSGRFRGAAHQSCNVNYNDARFIPVIFHNLSGYDSHLIIRDIATAPDFEGRITLIPQNKEKYIAFTKYIEGSKFNIRFIDSFRFLPSSLDKLSSYLKQHPIVENEFEKDDYSSKQISLLKKKGIYPYEYTSSYDRLKTTQLPAKEHFYSCLNDEGISDEQYAHAQTVWEAFNIQNLGEYCDIYLKTDVLLLADVFEDFRNNCMQSYKLDAAHYYTTPGFTWDAMLKFTSVKLDLLSDIDMLLFVERGIRGGVSQCSNRYGTANNEYMRTNYNRQKRDQYLIYLDVNNLYGHAMVQSLPEGDFKWVIEHDLDTKFWDVAEDNEFGYFLEVDLEYPRELHDKHKDFPFCPEHRAAPGSKHKKLMTTLYDKERYVLHYRNLQQALDHGLKLKKVHRALKFKQSPWLKKYIDFNSTKRASAKNEFEKLFYKLLNNAVYGKTMENERKRVDVKLINKWEGRYGAEALISKPNFNSCNIIEENLVAIQLDRTAITIQKPLYIGLTVLELSKICVYRFNYDVMKEKLGDKCKMLYTDTDSFVYEIKDHNIYDFIKDNINEFDTSDYKSKNQFDMPQKHKKILGKMKDECAGSIMTHFIGLRSKMYCSKIQGQNSIKKAKGVKSNIVKKTIEFEDYYNCLFNDETVAREQIIITSHSHELCTEKQSKIALSAHDDKRYLIPNSTDTLPWGHYAIPATPEEGEPLEEDEPLTKRQKTS